MGNRGGSIAVGLADGVLKGLQLRRQWAGEDEEREWRNEERESRRSERKRAEGDRIALQNAAAPAAVSKPQDVMSDDDGNPMPAAPGFEVSLPGQTGKRVATQEEADATAAKHNDPAAMAGRVSLALAQQGKPTEALAFQSKAEEFAEKRWKRRIQDALGGGFDGLTSLVNDSEAGVFRGKKVKPVTSADGKSVTFAVVGEDGIEKPTQLTFPNDQKGLVQAAYMLDSSVPLESRYKTMVEEDKRAATNAVKERELDLRKRQLEEVQIPNAETKAQLAQVQAQLAEVRAARAGRSGNDGVSREERLRYTTLFTDAGRRMQDVQKALNTMRQDRSFMKRAAVPGSPESVQVQELQGQLAEHKDERETYRGLLGAQKSDGKGAGLADVDAKPGAAKQPKGDQATKEPPKVASKAERDKLPKGTRYIGPDGQTYIKQ